MMKKMVMPVSIEESISLLVIALKMHCSACIEATTKLWHKLMKEFACSLSKCLQLTLKGIFVVVVITINAESG